MNANTTYPETQYNLEPNTQITVVTDGVVEARAESGELFGFDRTQRISRQPAAEIARAAQAFGQDDDVTVLTLAFARNPIGG